MTKLLIPGAGTGPSNNLIRSLKVGDPSLFIVGYHADRFALKKSLADRNYVTLPPNYPNCFDEVLRIIEKEKIDLLLPIGDSDVELFSARRDTIPCRLFLPPKDVIELAQDKYALTTFLKRKGIPVAAAFPVTSLRRIEKVFQQLAPHKRLWCRMRTGTGSMGATPVTTPEQARSWIRYWEEIREIPPAAFMISEYLPGRDFACQTVWKDGRPVLTKTIERLSYFWGWNRPSGVSSIAALAKAVYEPRVVEVCTKAVRLLGDRISGAFSFDLKENAKGIPCVTELNAGRLLSGTNLFDLAGKHNVAVTFVRLAMGETVEIDDHYEIVEDYYMLRDLDTIPGIVHADELFEGIEEV